MEEKKKNKKKLSKKAKLGIIIPCSILVGLLAIAGGYVGYIFSSYYRIGNMDLTPSNKSNLDSMSVNTKYSALTYNIGFGAYSQDFTFFMDDGYDDSGNKTCGYYGKAKSKEEVDFNVNGAIKSVSSLSPDFVLFQEVDTDSTRSYHINEYERINEAFPSYSSLFCENFHSAFLPYPLYDMHGAVTAGLTSISKFKMGEAKRYQYTISDSVSKLFDLDRCFASVQYQVDNGKSLYVVNSHMSAYDSGGTIRAKQVQELNAFLEEKKQNGDYVIVGGDFNHDLLTFNPDYDYNNTSNRAFHMSKKAPDWVSYYFSEDGSSPLIDGYRVVASDNIPTCRNNDIEWDAKQTYQVVVDGFIVSDNIEISLHQNIATNGGNKGTDWFAFSDHQPAYIEFQLK